MQYYRWTICTIVLCYYVRDVVAIVPSVNFLVIKYILSVYTLSVYTELCTINIHTAAARDEKISYIMCKLGLLLYSVSLTTYGNI